MTIWSSEIRELEKLHHSVRETHPKLHKELSRLIKTDDENIALVYARRCLEIIISDLCECELKRPRGSEPLKGIIDKLNREGKVPPHIIGSINNINSISTFGAHPKEFDPEQVKPVLLDLTTTLRWYMKYDDTRTDNETGTPESDRGNTQENLRQKSGIPRKRIFQISAITLAVAAIVVFLILSNLFPWNKKPDDAESLEKSIAILPFKNISPDAENQYLLDGIMEAVINYLTQIENIRVIASTSVQQYRGTQKTISEIGNELNVTYVLEGSGQKYDKTFRLTTKLSDARNSSLIWSNPYDRNIDDILEFQSEVAQRIVSELRLELSSEAVETLSERPTFSKKAYSKYLEAQNSNTHKAIELLEESIEIDPSFVDAYIQLARVHQSRANVAKGELSSTEALKLALPLNTKALEINPNHIGARVQLGFIKYMLEWDFKGAEREFIKASEISARPINYVSFLIQTKRFVEALELAAQLRAYDPITANYETMLSYLFLGEYNKALNLSGLGAWAARIYMAMQDYDKAITILKNTLESNRIPFYLSDLAICYSFIGEKDKANEILHELFERYSKGEQGSIAFAIGRIYSGTEEVEKALEWLENSYQNHEVEMIWLYADPAFETLQDNEHYIDLLKRVGFDV